MQTVLGIDLGTQNVKVAFYDFENRDTVAVESAPLDLSLGENGQAEQKADWWTHALSESLLKVGESVRKSVVAIGVSGQQHGFVPVDGSGEVLAPVKLWCDTSTGAECDAIMADFGGPEACIEQVGNPILAGYTASKVRWFRDRHPGLYAQMTSIMLPHDYLNFYLTGERCMEAGDASGTGFFSIRDRDWSREMLSTIDPGRDLGECLPDVQTHSAAIGSLRDAIADELGLPAGVPIATGGGDNMMGAIGTGNVRPGTVTMSLGTSGTVYAYSDQPVIDPKGNIAAFCSSTGGWLPLLCTMNCTVSTELMRALVNADIAGFEAQVATAGRGAGGLLTVPFFNGERTPDLPNAKACVLGLDTRNSKPENLLRSAVEGATFALRFGIDELGALGISTDQIVLTGGGANSPTWRQVVADVCNAPVVMLKQEEGAAFGAALQALAMLDNAGNELPALVLEHLEPDADRSTEPRSSAVSFYQDSYSRYQRAVESVTELYG
jgi:xylulokinase